MNSYELTRKWFDFAFEKHEAKVQHTALFCWIIELNNRLGWKQQFGLPTNSTMEGLSIGNKNTFLSALNDLQDWGFIKIVKPSKNQYQSCIISICCNKKATALHTALDTALIQHSNSIDNGTVPIDKQVNQETNKTKETKELKEKLFNQFWESYQKKVGKPNTLIQWNKLTIQEMEKIVEVCPKYIIYHPDPKYRKDPERFLKNKCWEDELVVSKPILPKSDGIYADLNKNYKEL